MRCDVGGDRRRFTISSAIAGTTSSSSDSSTVDINGIVSFIL
jgi:hypothetical protein